MKVLLVIALVVSVAYCLPAKRELDDDWAAYKKAFGRQYGSEELKRRQIWETTVEKVAAHNREYDLGLKSYRLAVNKFADLTHEEFVQKYTGQRVPKLSGKRNVYKAGPITDADVDWRTQGYVTGVKDQGQCGSCWAFSTTGATEGQHFKATGQLVSLSEQNLVDCAGPEGDAGCDGGWMDYAFQYIIDSKGIDTEDSYPYEGVDGSCRFNPNNVGATISSFTDIPTGDENSLTSASQSVGPIAVAIDASWNFQLYDSGVLDDADCLNGHDDLNHGVLVVGYGSDGGNDYYIVKNSWGDSFGEAGYIRMSRNKNNQCGIATVASYPNV